MTVDLSKIKLDLIVKNRKAELYLDDEKIAAVAEGLFVSPKN